MKRFLKICSGMLACLVLAAVCTACTPEPQDGTSESGTEAVGTLPQSTVEQGSTTSENPAAGTTVGVLSYRVPEEVEKLLHSTYQDLFGDRQVPPAGAGEGSYYYYSAQYPGLAIHFGGDKQGVTAIGGNISYLVPGYTSLTAEQFRQVFGQDSLEQSDLSGAYLGFAVLADTYKMYCPYDQEKNALSEFTLAYKD